MKPQISAVLTLPHTDFDRLWALALSGRPVWTYLLFTTPRYGKALIVNASFSTERED